MNTDVEFDNFRFDGNSGELVHTDEIGHQTVARLQPQPAALLLLLISNAPDVVTHKMIQEALWPEVHVDYDGSLHFCIRQIRTALKDDSANPKYIETLPRRGYRWIAPLKRNEFSERPITQQRPSQKKWIWITLIVVVILTTTMLLINFGSDAGNEGEKKNHVLRIAIMPMQTSDSNNVFFQNRLANELLEKLTDLKKYEIIGPTTTVAYDSDILKRALSDSIDYIINARYSDNPGRVLIELIRVSNGAHVWVQSFSAEDGMIPEIMEGVKGLKVEE